MLFDAEFTPASMMSNLRKVIQAEKRGLGPTRTPIDIESGSGRSMRGELYESPKGVNVNYAIRRSSGVAFDFYSVYLEQPPLAKISLQVKNTGSHFGPINPVLGTQRQLEEQSAATKERIEELKKPNWRVWSWKSQSGVSFKAWAGFGGMLTKSSNSDRSKDEVLLRNRNGEEVRVPAIALEDKDWNWARKGRIWDTVKDPASRQTQMWLVEDKGKELRIGKESNVYTVQIDDLMPEDKAFINGLRSFQKTKPDTSEQLPKWLEFAPYVRK
jgi:hypothetical protein